MQYILEGETTAEKMQHLFENSHSRLDENAPTGEISASKPPFYAVSVNLMWEFLMRRREYVGLH